MYDKYLYALLFYFLFFPFQNQKRSYFFSLIKNLPIQSTRKVIRLLRPTLFIFARSTSTCVYVCNSSNCDVNVERRTTGERRLRRSYPSSCVTAVKPSTEQWLKRGEPKCHLIGGPLGCLSWCEDDFRVPYYSGVSSFPLARFEEWGCTLCFYHLLPGHKRVVITFVSAEGWRLIEIVAYVSRKCNCSVHFKHYVRHVKYLCILCFKVGRHYCYQLCF